MGAGQPSLVSALTQNMASLEQASSCFSPSSNLFPLSPRNQVPFQTPNARTMNPNPLSDRGKALEDQWVREKEYGRPAPTA